MPNILRTPSDALIEKLAILADECEQEGFFFSLTEWDYEKPLPLREGFRKLHHLFAGLFYGYPLCCIWYFLRREDEINGVAVEYAKCDKCRKKENEYAQKQKHQKTARN